MPLRRRANVVSHTLPLQIESLLVIFRRFARRNLAHGTVVFLREMLRGFWLAGSFHTSLPIFPPPPLPRGPPATAHNSSGSCTFPNRQPSHHWPGSPPPSHGIGPLILNSCRAFSGIW